MLGLAHTLVADGLHDEAFLARYTVGFDKFRAYLMGESDGTPKSADWAGAICEIDAERIRALAGRMAAKRTMIATSYSLQRGDHGEQTFWMTMTLAAMLGQIGLPGGGFGFGYGSMHGQGNPISAPLGFAFRRRQSDRQFHPGRPHCRSAAQSRRPVRLRWRAPPIPRHQDHLLVRRQSLPSSPGPQPSHRRLAAAGHRDRQRAVLDPDGEILRHRAAGDDDLGAQRHWRIVARSLRHGDEEGGRATGRGAPRLSRSSAASRAGSASRRASPWAGTRWNGCACSTRRRARRPTMPAAKSRTSTPSGSRAIVETAMPETFFNVYSDYREDPGAKPLPTPSGKFEIFSETHRRLRLCRLSRPSRLDGAGRVARQ